MPLWMLAKVTREVKDVTDTPVEDEIFLAELEQLYRTENETVVREKRDDYRREKILYGLRDELRRLMHAFDEEFCSNARGTARCKDCLFKEFDTPMLTIACMREALWDLQRCADYAAGLYGYRLSPSLAEEKERIYERARERRKRRLKEKNSTASSARWWKRFWKNGKEEENERH